MQVPSKRERTQRVQSQTNDSGNNFLRLFADIDITPALLASLSEVDVLRIALVCSIVLDILTISQVPFT